ncbi:MAG: dipeptide epimerase [Acidobacteria bacterium]|nr:dipeptide epimerase [Acidobacteriota bacterium]MCA1612066.1 dipeptide epimerase [Acidobacteriota bacterium]
MKILGTRARRERVPLRLPYRVAGRTTEAVEMFLLEVETDDRGAGLGAATPEAAITGETVEACSEALSESSLDWLSGQDVLRLGALCQEAGRRMRSTPGALAAVDMALHDLYARRLGVPLADALGRVHASLPTSVTIGIQARDEAVALAEELVGRGFRILKVKVGEALEEDTALIRRLHERFGSSVRLRADANVGYTPAEAVRFLEAAGDAVEFLEQPVPRENDGLRRMPERWRSRIAADESLLDERDALTLAAGVPACGIFNIKLMKSGGIRPALRIAAIADAAGIELMWGCMDESVIGIAAALHAALACPATRYLDLDGSFDLAEDPARGGFTVSDGEMTVTSAPGLGVDLV